MDQKLVRGLKLNLEKIKFNLHDSVAILTYLATVIGHDMASAAALEVKKSGKSPREVLSDSGVLSGEKYDDLVKPEKIRMLGFVKQERTDSR